MQATTAEDVDISTTESSSSCCAHKLEAEIIDTDIEPFEATDTHVASSATIDLPAEAQFVCAAATDEFTSQNATALTVKFDEIRCYIEAAAAASAAAATATYFDGRVYDAQ